MHADLSQSEWLRIMWLLSAIKWTCDWLALTWHWQINSLQALYQNFIISAQEASCFLGFFMDLRVAARFHAYLSPRPRQRSNAGLSTEQQVFGPEPQPWRFWIRIFFSCAIPLSLSFTHLYRHKTEWGKAQIK